MLFFKKTIGKLPRVIGSQVVNIETNIVLTSSEPQSVESPTSKGSGISTKSKPDYYYYHHHFETESDILKTPKELQTQIFIL